MRNSRKTERGAIGSWIDSGVRAAPFALLRNSRKTERGAIGSWIDSGVRAAPFALLRLSPPLGFGFHERLLLCGHFRRFRFLGLLILLGEAVDATFRVHQLLAARKER